MEDLICKGVGKQFPKEDGILEVFANLTLVIPAHAVTIILGKSGCGKTTLLRLLAGLDLDFTGEIVRPKNCKTAVVFQEPRLMPWLNVWKNIAFGMDRRNIDETKIQHLIEITGLTGFARAMPSALSGGMQQRVAIARALATEPDFLLMDEPFASLDYFTRVNMGEMLLSIHTATECGIFFITHNIDEALTLGDEIVVLKDKDTRICYPLNALGTKRDLNKPEMICLKREILNVIEREQ